MRWEYLKRNIIREIYGPVKEAERWGIGINEKIKSILQREDIVKFLNQHRVRWYGVNKRMQDQGMPKLITTVEI